MNGYNLTRKWFDFTFENHEAKVQHTAIYLWCVELNNRLGWKDNFRLPTSSTMEGLSIGNKNTFLSALKDLESWGFIKIISESKNQNQARIISLCRSESEPAQSTALDMALIQQSDGNGNGTGDGSGVGTVPIDKQLNKETIKHIQDDFDETPKPDKDQNKKFVVPTIEEVAEYVKSKHPLATNDRVFEFAEKFWSHYENKNWNYSGNKKMKNWHLAIPGWKETIEKTLYPSNNGYKAPASPPRKSKVEYYNTRWPDRISICTEEQFQQICEGNPDQTYVVKRKYSA